MNDRLQHIASLIVKEITGEIDAQEKKALLQWLDKSEANPRIYRQLVDATQLAGKVHEFSDLEQNKQAAWLKILEKGLPQREPLSLFAWKKYVAAALVLLCIGSGLYLWRHNRKAGGEITTTKPLPKNDLAPGRNGAVLTLADGRTVVLDSASNGKLAVQGSTKVIKLDDGQLAYRTEKGLKPAAILYNRLSTPRGRQFQLTLPDGSRVWLNAASSIKYPTFFSGKERIVEITGEAYFEIVHNAAMPFHVKANNLDIIDLGTHFNINAYADEPFVKTTLLEGKVKLLTASLSAVVLMPGQQAVLGQQLVVDDAPDVEAAMAWKNGYFTFKNASIETIMRQVSRWYNVDITYKGVVPDKFHVDIPRSAKVSAVFMALQAAGGVHFQIADNKIIVSQ